MAFSIRTNVASLNAQKNLFNNTQQLEKAMGSLSSGMRITKASDDAAGLGVSVSLEAQIRSYQQAGRNAQDGLSMVQTAEGAMNEVSNILVRMREIATESASDALTTSQREFLDLEKSELNSELDRLSGQIQFNGTNLLDGSAGTLTFQTGAQTTDTITVDFSTIKVSSTDLALTTDIKSLANAQTAIGQIDTAIQNVSQFRATLGAKANRFTTAVNTIGNAVESLSSANSRVRDADVAEESARMARAQVLQQAAVSVTAQANQQPQLALKLLG